MRFFWKVCVGVCAVWFVLGTALPAFADGPITSAYFGMDDGGVTSPDPEAVNLARATGASYLRMALYWKYLEPTDTTPENYNWLYTDTYFQRAFDGDMIPLVYITENPTWAANLGCGPIDTTDATLRANFGEMMGALAARYPQIKYWILYNEADSSILLQHTGGCFGDHDTGDLNNNGVPDYADYAEMAGLAYDAVHQANPDAFVSLAVAFDDFDQATCPPDYPGGCPTLSHFNYNFLPNLFGYMAAHPRPEGKPYADLLTYTYYDVYGPYWEQQPSGAGLRGIQAKAAAIQKRMTDAGVTFGLFVTETGNDSVVNGTDGQSRCVAITLTRGMAIGLRTVVWWTFMDNPAHGWYYGLVDTQKNLKPSYQAYKTLFAELNGWTYIRRIVRTTKTEGYRFVNNGKTKWVLWSAVATSAPMSPCAYARQDRAHMLKAKRIQVTDLYGVTKIIRDNRAGDANPIVGRIGITLTGSPQYVTILR